MAARWSADSVLALAPDDSARRAAGPLSRPAPWRDAGATEDLVWGWCAGSGKNSYQVAVDLSGPAFRCSCPSRKFPCKHALGLLLLWSSGAVPDAAGPADFARDWQDARREKQRQSAAKSSARTEAAGSATASGGGPDALAAAVPRDEAGAARRAAERAERVAAGLADLQEWLRDQVRVGLASAAATPRAVPASGAAGGGRHGGAPAELMAARMVDAQAPGVAGTLRGLSGLARTGPGGTGPNRTGPNTTGPARTGSGGTPAGTTRASGPAGQRGDPAGPEWPARLLAEYGLLHLLARAHERLDALPADLVAVVRSRIGYPVSRQQVLARPAVPGRWLVLAVRDLTDGTVPGRRVWLREAGSGQWALLLTFAAPNGVWQDPDTARLRLGTEVLADLHYYPGQPPLRAVLGQRLDAAPLARSPGSGHPVTPADAGPAGAAAGGNGRTGSVSGLLAQWAAALEQDPWLTTWPALLTGTPVPADEDGRTSGWLLVDPTGDGLPLADRESLWTLLAVSGGRPVTVAGEWHPDGLVALTTWHGAELVPL